MLYAIRHGVEHPSAEWFRQLCAPVDDDGYAAAVAAWRSHDNNLQLLCTNCNSIKGDRPMAYLRSRLAELEAERQATLGITG